MNVNLETTYEDLKLSPLRLIAPSTAIKSVLEIFRTEPQVGIVSHTNPNNVIGIISFLDITRYMIPKLLSKKDCFQDPIEWTLTLSPEHESYKLWERDLKDTIKDALEAFTSGLHHGMITDTNKHQLLTQSSILNYLVKSDLDLWKQSIKQAFPWKNLDSPNKLIEVANTSTVGEAFSALRNSQLPALPVVEGNKLVTVVSTHDILLFDQFKVQTQMDQPIAQFLVNKNVITCKADVTCGRIIELMHENHVSRVWCVDENGMLTGVISQSDILGAMMNLKAKQDKHQ